MQDLEDNMDELFRKAAENYTPKKGESQWNKILPELSGNAADSPIIIHALKKNNAKKYAGLSSLFLLLILSTVMFMKLFNDKNETAQLNKSSEKNKLNNADAQLSNPGKKTIMAYKKQSTENKSSNKKNNAVIELIKNKTVSNQQLITQLNIAKNSSTETIKEIKKGDEENSSGKKNDAANKTNQLKNADTVQSTFIKNSSSLKKQHNIYIGIVSGPEFNEVKNQGIKKLGFDAGIIAGYKLSNKASIETGLLYNRKKYFSDGKYFSMDKMGSSMPAGMEVMSLEGSSTFFEIPVKFKYDVLHKKNAAFFSSAGISSYIITSEKNNYLTLLNGSEQNMKGSYKNAMEYFAATVDVSIGYEHKIGKHTAIRIEPYLQIPLKGVGIGSMPVSSAGLHAGVVKFIH